jgi:hypothetical protein
MRSSLVGTRARGEAEPYCQEAHVTDAARVRLKGQTRDTLIPWASLRRWLRGKGTKQGVRTTNFLPRNHIFQYGRAGASRALYPTRLVPRVVRHVTGSKGHLRPHKTCDTSKAGTSASFIRVWPGMVATGDRSADDQRWSWGRQAVVAGGVTTTQGCG